MPNCVPPLIGDGNPENYLKAGFFSTLFCLTSFLILKTTGLKNSFGELFV